MGAWTLYFLLLLLLSHFSRVWLCDPIDGSPLGSPVPGILQARTLEWVAISFSNAWKGKVKMKSLSPARLLATPWTAAYQAPPSMGFSRQEYWSGVPLPSLYFLLILGKELSSTSSIQGLPWWYSGWESTCQCREYGFAPWSGKIPHASKQLSLRTTTTEAHVPGACGPQEKPPQWEARALQQRVAPC